MGKALAKKRSTQAMKKKAWAAFSRYIRLKECLETTCTTRHGCCTTCGDVIPYNELQAGHFVNGRSNGVLFDERGVHIQCRTCNLFKQGNKEEYEKVMMKRYGLEVIKDLEEKARTPIKIDYTEIARIYKEKADLLEGI
jgi:hypothetical protein